MEQYINMSKFGTVLLQNRFSLEQRFIEKQTEDVFAQRLRYFVRAIRSFAEHEEAFTKCVLRQCRMKCFNHRLDLEAGYMNQYVKGLDLNVSNNILQMTLYTRFRQVKISHDR